MGELSPVTAKRRCHLHRSRIFVWNCLCCHLWLCLSMRELLWDESFRLDVDYYFDIADKGRIEIENKCSALNWGENPRMFTYLNTCFQVLSHCHPSIIKVSKKKKNISQLTTPPPHTHTHTHTNCQLWEVCTLQIIESANQQLSRFALRHRCLQTSFSLCSQ